MNFKIYLLAAASIATLCQPVQADVSETFGKASSAKNAYGGRAVPGTAQNAQHWTSPDGCTYARTQAPGL